MSLPLGPLDNVIPPCFISCTWLLQKIDHERVCAAFLVLLREHYPWLTGKLQRSATGEWRIEKATGETLSDDRFVERSTITQSISAFQVPFHQWPEHKLVRFMNPSPDGGEPIVRFCILNLTDGIACTLYIHHCVFDGRTFFTFCENWAKLVTGNAPSMAARFQRPVIAAASNQPTLPELGFDERKALTGPPKFSPMQTARFHFSADSLKQLKDDCGEGVSTNDCICAVLWIACSAARGFDTTRSVCSIAVDVRKVICSAEEADSFAGNAIVYATAECSSLSSTQLPTIARLIRQAVNAVTAERVHGCLGWLSTHSSIKDVTTPGVRVLNNAEILISNWRHFSMAGPFGAQPLFAGPVMPSTFRGVDGINVICDDPNGGLNVFCGHVISQAVVLLTHPTLLKYASIC